MEEYKNRCRSCYAKSMSNNEWRCEVHNNYCKDIVGCMSFKNRYIKINVRGQFNKNDISRFSIDLKDIHDKQLYRMFKEQDRIDSEAPYKPRNNELM